MPAPTYVNNAGTWRQQRGTVFGTDREGKDFIELVYRGATDKAFLWRLPWRAGKACPEPGFTHCKLVNPPTVREAAPGFSEARLRFEGLSPLSGSAAEGTDATITHSTEETEFQVYFEGLGHGIYLYNRVVVQASYIRATKPTASLRYSSELNDDPAPTPSANVYTDDWYVNFTDLKSGVHYTVETNGRVLNWSQTAQNVYEVTEEHTKYLVGKHVNVG